MKHRAKALAGMALGVIGTAVLALAPIGAPSAFAGSSGSSATLSCGGDSLSFSWSYNKALSEVEYIVGLGQTAIASGNLDQPSTNTDQVTISLVGGDTYTVQLIFVDLKGHVVKQLAFFSTVKC